MAFLSKVKQVKRGDLLVDTVGDQQKGNSPDKIKTSTFMVDKGLGLFRSETIDQFLPLVMKESDLDNLGSDADKIDRLTKYSTFLYILRDFDLVYYSIYGTQLQLLQQLNTFAVENRDTLKRFYDASATQNPKLYETYS